MITKLKKWMLLQGLTKHKEKIMEATNFEMVALFLAVLGFGSSLIHYTAYAKSKADAKVSILKTQAEGKILRKHG